MTQTDSKKRKGCLYIRPLFAALDSEKIAACRVRFDPLADKISPHITLVFPFALTYGGELNKIIESARQAVAEIAPFRVTLDLPRITPDGYAVLPVGDGADTIHGLHDALYSTPLLAPFLRNEYVYVPHLTVGCVPSRNAAYAWQLGEALATTIREPIVVHIEELVVESFGADEQSVVEACISLSFGSTNEQNTEPTPRLAPYLTL